MITRTFIALKSVSWSHCAASLFAMGLAGSAAAHAMRDVLFPYCKPEEHFIETSVAGRMQAAEAASKTAKERYEVTTFITVATGAADSLEITTGTKWGSMTATAPLHAYCYASLPGLGKQAVVTLANRSGWGEIVPVKHSQEQTDFIKRTNDELAALAKTHCRWMTESNS